jgi:NAD(P)-dependent dehydrogenase (short-subunit alcohol dehydrogenase family)
MSDPTKTRKTVLVTGGSRGLGRHTALAAAHSGFDVVITYRSQREAAEAVSSQIEALGRTAAALSLDTSDVASFDDFATRLKHQLRAFGGTTKLHGLVNNAGIGLDASIETTSEEMFDQLVNIHFKGVFFLTQKLLSLIEDGGRIVNTPAVWHASPFRATPCTVASQAPSECLRGSWRRSSAHARSRSIPSRQVDSKQILEAVPCATFRKSTSTSPPKPLSVEPDCRVMSAQ